MFGGIKFENTRYHPQGNGLAESRMKSIPAMLRAYVKEENRWDVYCLS
jgi:hypothetical protein